MAAATLDVPQPPWTYDLEIALFGAIVSFRPIGIHKAFRLISILNAINATLSPTDTPLTLADLKSKLDELFNMEALEDQEGSEDTESETKQVEEFAFPYEDVVGIIEDRGRGVEGDMSAASSPEAVMSVKSGRSGAGRGMKRRREGSSAVTNTDIGTDDEGQLHPHPTQGRIDGRREYT
jgi:hypothetical protein